MVQVLVLLLILVLNLVFLLPMLRFLLLVPDLVLQLDLLPLLASPSFWRRTRAEDQRGLVSPVVSRNIKATSMLLLLLLLLVLLAAAAAAALCAYVPSRDSETRRRRLDEKMKR